MSSNTDQTPDVASELTDTRIDAGVATTRIAELEEALEVAYARIRALEEAIIDTQKGLDPSGQQDRIAAYRSRKLPWKKGTE